jgi:sugar/nucleoside kinase (ribokinase family)
MSHGNRSKDEGASKALDVSVVGEINPDLIFYGLPRDLPEEKETLASGFQMTLGSSSAIFAHNLALLGSRVGLTSRIGPDALGEMCCRTLREAGVDLGHVIRSSPPASTGVTLILPLVDTRRILTYPGTMYDFGIQDIDIEYVGTARHFHLSSLFLHRKLSPDIPRLFSEMKRKGLTTSLDTNDDPAGEWCGVLHEVLPFVDLLLCTETELLKIAGMDDLEAATQRMTGRVPLLVVKRGMRGASAYIDGRRIDSPALRVDVTDSVGAGDTFDAGFIHQWSRQAPIDTCLRFGNVAAALSVTRSGGVEAFKDSAYRQQFFASNWHAAGSEKGLTS